MVSFNEIRSLKFTLDGDPVRISKLGVDSPENSLYLFPNGYKPENANHYIWDSEKGSYVIDGDYVYSFTYDDYYYNITVGSGMLLIGGNPENWESPNMEFPFTDTNCIMKISYLKSSNDYESSSDQNMYDIPYFRPSGKLWKKDDDTFIGSSSTYSVDTSKCKPIRTNNYLFNSLGEGTFEMALLNQE